MGFRQAKGIADINKEPQAPKQEEMTAPVTQVAAPVVSEPNNEATVGVALDVTKLLEKPEAKPAEENVAVVETKQEEKATEKKPAVKKKVTSTKKTKS